MKSIKILALLQARTSSSRLPGKVLRDILGVPMLLRQIERENLVRSIDHLVVVTSDDKSDDLLSKVLRERGVDCYRGSLNDVLDRFYQAAKLHNPVHVVRLTGDCPLVDFKLVDDVITEFLSSGVDYFSNISPPTYPDGLDVEVFSWRTLDVANLNAESSFDREHVTPYIKASSHFSHGNMTHKEDLSHLRWTLDEPEDFQLLSF